MSENSPDVDEIPVALADDETIVSIHLGYHETRELARLAYIEATDRLNGQFARIE